MAKAFSKSFYKSRVWQDCREAYAKSQGYLCERCQSRGLFNPGTEVHHKIVLTPDNINDSAITTSFENLQLLCWQCHREVHRELDKADRDADQRYIIDANGVVHLKK